MRKIGRPNSAVKNTENKRRYCKLHLYTKPKSIKKSKKGVFIIEAKLNAKSKMELYE